MDGEDGMDRQQQRESSAPVNQLAVDTVGAPLTAAPTIVHNHFHISMNFTDVADVVQGTTDLLSSVMRGNGRTPTQPSARDEDLPDVSAELGLTRRQGNASASRGPKEAVFCSICLTTIPVCVLPCGHVFCRNCTLKLIEELYPCALCYKPFQGYVELDI